jgi:hypothetical protein
MFGKKEIKEENDIIAAKALSVIRAFFVRRRNRRDVTDERAT